MANEDKRIIELPASESILNDDWIGKDSASEGTTKIQLSLLKQLFGGNNFAGEWHSGTTYSKDSYVTREGKLYHNITGSATSTTWKASQWQEIAVSSELKKVVGSLAPTFDSSVNYDVGDLVTFNNGLCRCISPHSAGAWNSSHFAVVKVSSLLLSYIMDNFTDKQWENYSGSPVNYTKGTVIHKGLNLYRCKANTTNQSWDNSKWEQVDVTDLINSVTVLAETILSNIAPTFSSSMQYNINEFVIYNNQLYVCIKPHHGSWDATDFSAGIIGYILEAIFNNIADVYSPSGSYVKGDVVNYLGMPLRCIVDTATSPMVFSEWEQVTVAQLIDEKRVNDVQIAGQTTVDENKISDLTSLAIEGTASGEIATFNDGSNLPMRSFVCNIDAEQDLHGYDAPWVGGAGKNKLPNREGVGDSEGLHFKGTNGVYEITGTATWTYPQWLIFNGTLEFPVGTTITLSSTAENVPSGAQVYCILYERDTPTGTNLVSWSTKNSNPRTFTIEHPYQAFTIVAEGNGITHTNTTIAPQIELGSTATSWTPYSNICPISGHTGVNAWVRGKNLLPMTVESIKAANTRGTWSGNTYTVNGGTVEILVDNKDTVIGIKLNGTFTDFVWVKLCQFTSFPLDMKLNGCPNGGDYTTYGYQVTDADNVSIYGHYNSGDKAIPKGSYIVRIRIAGNCVCNNVIFYPMLRLASDTDSTFAPYNPNSQIIQVSWQTEAGEVFGGEVDLVSGVLVADRLYFEISNFDSWEYQEYNNFKALYKNLSVLGYPPIKNTGDKKVISDKFKYSYEGAYQPFGVFSIYSNGNIYFWNNDNTYANKNEMITAMNSIKPSVCYELATPITYQLTPTQIKSLVDDITNAWCSTGDVNVKYNKDATIAYEDIGGGGSELITFGAGDGTTSRTFQLSRTPRKITMAYFEGNDDSGWASQYTLIWGVARAFGTGTGSPANTSGEAKSVGITYGADNKSFTVNASNAGSAMNTTSGHGYLMVEY